MIRRPPRSTLDRSSAASDVYKRERFVSIPSPSYSRLLPESRSYQSWRKHYVSRYANQHLEGVSQGTDCRGGADSRGSIFFSRNARHSKHRRSDPTHCGNSEDTCRRGLSSRCEFEAPAVSRIRERVRV